MPKDYLPDGGLAASPVALDAAWGALKTAAKQRNSSIADSFVAEPDRMSRFTARCGGLFADLSKQDIDQAGLDALMALARAARVDALRDAMFSGETINHTEGRAVLHPLLRASARDRAAGPADARAMAAEERRRAEAFAAEVIDGRARGSAGGFTDVINIGIGGSDLGPALVASALGHGGLAQTVHFVSNVDGAALGPLLKTLKPETTLVIVCSKTFSTLETRTNAETVKRWLVSGLGEAGARRHFAASTSAPEAAIAFGVDEDRIFKIWNWVGGRFSLWSTVGLAAMIAIGPIAFREFLYGAAAMDEHFVQAPFERNLPVLLGAVDVWQRSIAKRGSRAVAVYDERLKLLPSHLQQLEMESNGKGVDRNGAAVREGSAAVVWGGVGCDAQHAFFQMLHQGPDVIPVEFLIAKNGGAPNLKTHHRLLMANCFAQSRALMTGLSHQEAAARLVAEGRSREDAEALAPHMVCPGDRPSTTILLDQLDAHTLGMLLALAEHRVLVAGAIYGVNSFDQFGVELGKRIARSVDERLRGVDGAAPLDPSTELLIKQSS
ncbi:MAG: glucose-6-phosphate isomerase [Pseudomonadota bacterium]